MIGGNDMAHPAAVLRAALAHTEMSERELSVEYFAHGGPASPERLRDILEAGGSPTRHEYDQIASALNGWYVDRGLGHVVPYYDELWLDGDSAPSP